MTNTIVLPAVLSAVVLAGIGCDSNSAPAEPPEALAVTSVLDAYTDRQRVLLTTVEAANDDDPLLHRDDLVQSAEIHIGGVPFEVVPFDSVDRSGGERFESYNYVSDSLEVNPGQTYKLEVVQDGKSIRGETTVPSLFDGGAEGNRIFWHPSDGAARYHVEVTYDPPGGIPPRDRDNTLQYTYATSDTSVTVPSGSSFVSGRYFVTIRAIDPNLAAFQLEPVARSGVEGAYGVFGAITLIQGYIELPS